MRRGAARPRCLAALVLMALAGSGCSSWRQVSVPPQSLVELERPRRVRATLDDGRVLTLNGPTMVSDTIVGATRLGQARAPIGSLRALEVQRTSVPKTLALVIAHVSVVVSVMAIIVDVQPHYRGF